ncbi:MAG: NAD(P)/FAD-dependent oxidoreductase [Mycobacteriales bacterium]
MYDVLVIGGGPSGLAAATWLGRYRRSTLLVDSGDYRNAAVEASHGYLGSDGMNPADLRERARADLATYKTVEVRSGSVTSLSGSHGDFTAVVDGEPIAALRVVVATGVRDAFPEVGNFFEHYGASAFHCPTCDGYEASGKNVVAVGWSAAAAGFALLLLDWATSVTLVTDARRFEGDDACRAALARQGIELIEDDAVALEGARGDLRCVVLRGGRRLDCELFFFSIAHQPNASLALHLGCTMSEDGYVDVDESCETSVPGVYAAGDLTPGMQLVQVAAAKGAIAGVSAARSLQGEPGAPGSPEPAPDPEVELQRGR